MALTSSLSCVDYLSIKFGCQSLSSEKEIYNHLSQEWFYGPLIGEFSFHGKQDSWNSIFHDTNFSTEKKLGTNRRYKNSLNKRHKFTGIRNKGISESVGAWRDQCISVKFSSDTETSKCQGKEIIALKTEMEEGKNSDNFVLWEDIEKDAMSTSVDCDDDYYDDNQSDSELELLQICGKENIAETHSISENMATNFSRKRASTESLVECDNFAKRMRPSLDLTKMQNSRYSSNEDCDRFIPIVLPSSL